MFTASFGCLIGLLSLSQSTTMSCWISITPRAGKKQYKTKIFYMGWWRAHDIFFRHVLIETYCKVSLKHSSHFRGVRSREQYMQIYKKCFVCASLKCVRAWQDWWGLIWWGWHLMCFIQLNWNAAIERYVPSTTLEGNVSFFSVLISGHPLSLHYNKTIGAKFNLQYC